MISAHCLAGDHHLCRADLHPCDCPCGRPLHPSTAQEDVSRESPSSCGEGGLDPIHDDNNKGPELDLTIADAVSDCVLSTNPSSPPKRRNRRVTLERFLDSIAEVNTCWIWLGHLNADGYGVYGQQPAYRWGFQALVGPVGAGLQLDHLCRNRACVNPAHLEAVTQRENNRRSNSPTAVNARKTHCVNGHPLSGDNLRFRDGNRRICRTCHAIEERARKIRRGLRPPTQPDNGFERDLAGLYLASPSSPDPTFVEVTEEEADEWLWMRAEERFGPGAFSRKERV